jgi:RNA polymerase sigma-32 factor
MGNASSERDAELALIDAYRSGVEDAGDALVRAFRAYVVALALGYRKWGAPIDDLVQQGCIGLLRAARKFDASREVRFATYASYWIRAEIRDYVVRTYRLVRIGTTKRERRAIRAYRTSPTDDPQVLAERSGLTPERSAELLPLLRGREASFDLASMEAVVAPSIDAPTPEEDVEAHESRARAREAISVALSRLSERERMIVNARTLSDDDPVSLSTLSVRLGVTKERVRQIEQRAWEKLRVELEPLRADLAS